MIDRGDQVTMNDNYHVSDKNKCVVWTVISNPWLLCGTNVVLLDGFSGGYACDGLTKVVESEVNNDG